MADNSIFIGQSDKREELFLPMANRHGLVTGATGTGKTVTLQILAEGLCAAGVPVFAADVKGDLAGISQKGEPLDFLIEPVYAIHDPLFHLCDVFFESQSVGVGAIECAPADSVSPLGVASRGRAG